MKSKMLFFRGLLAAIAILPLPVRAAGLEGFVKVPYVVKDNRYILRCTLNGKPLNMVIDCGAYATLIDKGVFDSAIPKSQQIVPKGVPAKVSANGEPVPVLLARNLQAGGISFGDLPVLVYDMTRNNFFVRNFGRYLESANEQVIIEGLIGLDILRSHSAIIDTTHQVIYFDPTRSKRGGHLGDNMKRFGFKRVQMVQDRYANLEVPCTIQGKPGRMLVDTGAYLTLINYNIARAAGVSVRPSSSLMSGIKVPWGLGVGGRGPSELLIAEPSQFKVGEFSFQKAPVGCLPLDFATDGFLGPDYLEKGHAFLDFGDNSLFLK